MKKKNFLWSMFAIMMVTMLSVSLSACSSDDDKGTAVVGTWIDVYDEHTSTLIFRADNSGTWIEKHEHQGEEPYTETGKITYVPTSNTEGTMDYIYTGSDGKVEIDRSYYKVNGNKLHLYDDEDYSDYGTYTRQ